MEPAPNCAICNGPALPECRCESDRLKIAVDQAEKRAMNSKMTEIRDWVVNQAREQILKRFQQMTSVRKTAHSSYLSSLPYYPIYMQYSGNPPLHPQALNQLQHQIRDAHAELKRGIDADWRASVLRYPEVLDYFYSLVELRLPTGNLGSVEPPSFGAPDFAAAPFPGGSPVQKKKKRRDRDMASPAPPPMMGGGLGLPLGGGLGGPGRGMFEDQSYVVTGGKPSRAPPVAPFPPTHPSTPHPQAGYSFGPYQPPFR